MMIPTKAEVIAEIQHGCSMLKLDSKLHIRQCEAESNFNQAALSPCGAIGLFQLMPATADDLAVDPLNWQQNVQGGLTYMKNLYVRYKSIAKALAAYNWGIGHLDKCIDLHKEEWQSHLPLETSAYLRKILVAG
jgi:hypothetical protein